MGSEFVEALPVGKFHGVGPVTCAKMHSLGLHTGLDIRNQSLQFMQAIGRAVAYYRISRGAANRENTFSDDLVDFEAMVAELRPLIDKVWGNCEDKGVARPHRDAEG